jgi:hypothetical protein
MMRPNTVLLTLLAAAGAAGLVAVVIAAEEYGRWRQKKRAWLVKPGGTA